MCCKLRFVCYSSFHRNTQTGETDMQAPKSIQAIAGRNDIELTIRGARDFTLSFECIDKTATAKLAAFFGAKAEVQEDPECGTYIYITA